MGKNCQKSLVVFFVLLTSIAFLQTCQNRIENQQYKLRFGISFLKEQCKEALDGRMLLMISTDDSKEPRFQITARPDSQLIFGINLICRYHILLC